MLISTYLRAFYKIEGFFPHGPNKGEGFSPQAAKLAEGFSPQDLKAFLHRAILVRAFLMDPIKEVV